jgi:hypothetical protein
LEKACKHLEGYISRITHSVGDDVHVVRLHGGSVFKDARHAAEEQIVVVLREKIEVLLEDQEYQLLTDESRSEANEHIDGTFKFLTSTFAALKERGMPIDVMRHAAFETCRMISAGDSSVTHRRRLAAWCCDGFWLLPFRCGSLAWLLGALRWVLAFIFIFPLRFTSGLVGFVFGWMLLGVGVCWLDTARSGVRVCWLPVVGSGGGRRVAFICLPCWLCNCSAYFHILLLLRARWDSCTFLHAPARAGAVS